MNCYSTLFFFPTILSPFFFFFSQNYLCQFYFFNIELVKNLALQFFSFKILWIAMVFSYKVFLFYVFYFSKLYLSILFFYIELIENLVFVISFLKTLLITIVFLHMVFFFSKLSLSILIFNIELVKNYSYNKWENHCSFPRKLLWIASVFFPREFFLCFFLNLSLSILLFKY